MGHATIEAYVEALIRQDADNTPAAHSSQFHSVDDLKSKLALLRFEQPKPRDVPDGWGGVASEGARTSSMTNPRIVAKCG